MKENGRFKTGFTLVELMIVVAIIGLLASMAIPDYLKFTTRAKQVEAKSNLGAVFTAQTVYLTEYGTYSNLFTDIPWAPTGKPKYTYDLGSGQTVGAPPTVSPENADAPGAKQDSFTVLAYANLDNDLTVDTWQNNDRRNLKVKRDDANF